jgi:16S rRNA (adenine1518-N6/adenine1519-N6)-dimethyltransferase
VVKLGQNFLVDRNILGVIERLAALEEDDVVLEIGGGEGVLSTRLAALVAHVHVVEVDRHLEEGLRDVLREFPNVTIWIADALALELSALDPAPTAVVANLPYSIAANVILRTIEELPSVREWVVMVQREVGERLAASVGDPAYGVPSVLAQLACEVRILRPVARTVFRPVPRVDSVLVGLRRREGTPGVEPAVRSLVHDAFAHRRKALAGSLALAPDASCRWAIRQMSAPSGCRPTSSGNSPRGWAVREARRPGAGEGQSEPVPRAGPGGRSPRARDALRIGVAGG